MKKRLGSYPFVRAEGGGRGVLAQAGAVPLVETVRKSGLDTAYRPRWARGDASRRRCTILARVLLDVAVVLALGGDWLADVAMLRAEPDLVGPGGLRPDRLPADRHVRLQRESLAQRDLRRALPRPRTRLGAGR